MARGGGLAAFANLIDLMGVGGALAQEVMPGLKAEMRDVDDRRRIIRQHLQYLSRSHVFQAFARFQNGQGAEQPDGIQGGVVLAGICGHKIQIIRHSRPVHKDVTIAPRDLCPRLVYGSEKPVLGEPDVWN